MEEELGFPQSGMDDYSPYQPGDIVEVKNSGLYIRILKVHVERLQEITDVAAEKEGCQGVFSGTGATLGSGWDVTPSEEYANRWGKKSNEAFLSWDSNPWVEVIEFESISKEEAGVAADCKFCSGKTRISFRCDVRTLRDDGIVEDIPVPSIHCPYCGRVLEKA